MPDLLKSIVSLGPDILLKDRELEDCSWPLKFVSNCDNIIQSDEGKMLKTRKVKTEKRKAVGDIRVPVL